MKKTKSVLNHLEVIKSIGLNAHIMLCEIRNSLKSQDSFCKKSKAKMKKPYYKIYYPVFKKKFPFWTFKRYIKTKKYLINNKFIYKDVKNNYYRIRYSRLKELIQEV